MIEALTKQINVDKEVLNILPQNNIKNKKIYLSKLEEILNKYKQYQNKIYTEIEKRNNILTNINKNNKLDTLKEEIDKVQSIMYLYNDYKFPISKMGIDIIIYNLSQFNKLKEEDINDSIYKLISIYKEVGIDISIDSFKYSIFAYEYMKVYLNYLDNKQYNCPEVSECFEKLYWKCPDLITHLKLCFISIYYKNIKKFEKYLNDLKEQNTFDINNYYELIKTYDLIKESDIYILLNKFINKELNIKDYQEDKINKLLSELTDDSLEDISDDIQKLIYTLKEYKGYLDYLFLIEDINKLYEQRQSFKDCSKKTIKEITKKEKILSKYNKTLFKIWNKFNKERKINKYSIAINDTLKEINSLYIELEENLFKEQIYNSLNDSSPILDVLSLCYSNYTYLTNTIKAKEETIPDTSIKEIRKNLFTLITSPYNTIINNTTFKTTEDIKTIIKDKYNLINIKITLNNLEDSSILNFISLINNILIYKNITNSILKVNDIEFILESNEILQK